MTPAGAPDAPGAVDLIEAAFCLLRRAGAGAWACYYLGTLPFVLALLYFWADMSRSAFAAERCAPGALALAGLFVWMKCWQAAFAGRCRRRLAGLDEPPWTARRAGSLLLSQTLLQPSGLYLLAMASLVLAPLGWVYAFCQNVTALADGHDGGPWRLAARASRQAALWPGQNHAALGVLLVFSLLVWLNCLLTIVALPMLAKSLLGLEWTATRAPLWWLNTTTLATATALTYLLLDPLLKTVYVLRCFHGESLRTGDDLRAELQRHVERRRMELGPAALLLAVLATAALASAAPAPRQQRAAAEAPPADGRQQAMARQLDRAAEAVLARPKYAWRMPRQRRQDSGGPVGRFFDDVFAWLRKGLDAIDSFLQKLLRPRPVRAAPAIGRGWLVAPHLLLYLLLAVLVAAVGWLLWTFLRRRGGPLQAEAGPDANAQPDLTDESVGADRLPADGWADLARELLGRGELRLALRAMYLGCLAQLAGRELIFLARHKSDRDYQLELARRGGRRAALTDAFAANVRMFQDAWYGLHAVSEAVLERFRLNAERMRDDARA